MVIDAVGTLVTDRDCSFSTLYIYLPFSSIYFDVLLFLQTRTDNLLLLQYKCLDYFRT
jgi:hypothetical protein